MTPILATSDLSGIGIVILILLAIASAFTSSRSTDLRRLELKLDALIKHQGVPWPPQLPEEVQRLARDPSQKIAALKLLRTQQPELSLAEAKALIEAYARQQSGK